MGELKVMYALKCVVKLGKTNLTVNSLLTPS